jgi:hypothetical protein
VRNTRVAVAEERVRAVPLVDAEVGVELVGDGVPGCLVVRRAARIMTDVIPSS